MGAVEGREVRRETRYTLLGRGKDPLLSLDFVPTAIPTIQGTVRARTPQVGVWKVPGGAGIGERMATSELLLGP